MLVGRKIGIFCPNQQVIIPTNFIKTMIRQMRMGFLSNLLETMIPEIKLARKSVSRALHILIDDKST